MFGNSFDFVNQKKECCMVTETLLKSCLSDQQSKLGSHILLWIHQVTMIELYKK